MKVLFVCSGNNKNFEVIPFIKEQAGSLKAQGINVDFYPIVGKGLPGYLKAGLKLKNLLQKSHYDLVHAHYTLSGWAAVIGAGKIPVVLSLMGSDAYGDYIGVNNVRFSSRFNTLLTWMIQPFVKAIISKSENIEKYVYLKQKSYVIPNGINTTLFRPALNNTTISPTGKQQVLFLGNQQNVRKNYALAQAAIKRLNRADVELVNPYPVAHKQIPELLNKATVLIVPSLMEGSLNIVKEAMACNCPVVATGIGDVRWVLGDTRGCYVTSFNVEDVAEKLKLALAYASANGRTKGAERITELGLDAATIAKKVIAVYTTVLHQPQVSSLQTTPFTVAQE